MKRIILFVLLFAALKVAGQTTGYLRYDTVKIMKQNGTCELYVINKTKDSLGLLTNVGGGLTRFIKPKMLDDSTIIIGLDTVVIRGASGGQNVANASLTANGDYIQDWADKWFFLHDLKALEMTQSRTDPVYTGNKKTFSFYFDSTADAYPLWLKWSLRNTADNQDSLGADFTFGKNYVQLSNYDGSNFANIYASGNPFFPSVQTSASDGFIQSVLTVGASTISLGAHDSTRMKLVPAATGDTVVMSRSLGFGLNTLIKVPVSAISATLSNVGSGYRWVKTASGQIKSAENTNTVTWDSTANTLKPNVDTSYIATLSDLKDTAAAIRAASGGTPAGSTGNVQYNNAGSFGAEAAYTYNSTTDALTVGNTITDSTRYRKVINTAMVVDSFVANGNSITAGVNASTVDSNYVSQTGHHYGIPFTNKGVSGHVAFQACAINLSYINPGHHAAVSLEIGLNDLVNNGGSTNVYRGIRNAYEAAMVNTFLASYTAASSCTLTGSWTTGINAVSTAGGKTTTAASTTTNEDSLSKDITATGIGIGLIGAAGNAASAVIYIDGVKVDSFNTGQQTPAVGASYQPMGKYYTGLSNTSHHVKVVKRGGSGALFVDYVGALLAPASQRPFIMIDIPFLDSTGYALGSATSAATIIANDSLNNAFNRARRAGLKVYHAKTNNYYQARTDAGLSSDHVHPKDPGYRQIFNSIVAAIDAVYGQVGVIQFTDANRFYANDSSGEGHQIAYIDDLTARPITLNGINNTGTDSTAGNLIVDSNFTLYGNFIRSATFNRGVTIRGDGTNGATKWIVWRVGETAGSMSRFGVGAYNDGVKNHTNIFTDGYSGDVVSLGQVDVADGSTYTPYFEVSNNSSKALGPFIANGTSTLTGATTANGVTINGDNVFGREWNIYAPGLGIKHGMRTSGASPYYTDVYTSWNGSTTAVRLGWMDTDGTTFHPIFSTKVNGLANIASLTGQNDTTTYKPLVVNSSGDIYKMVGWPSAGGITGSGTSGRIAYWSGSSSLTSNSSFLFNGSVFSTGTTNTQGQINVGGSKDLTSSGAQSYYAAATYTDQATSASSTASSYNINLIGSPTIAAANSSVTFPLISTLAIVAPTAGTNATLTKRYALLLEPSSGNNANLGVSGFIDGITHLRSGGSGASIAAGAGAGTGASGSVSGGDMAGKIDITTGSSPSTSATVVTITFNATYAAAPTVILTPGNAAAAALTGGTQVFVSSTSTTNFLVTSGSSALGASTQYIWYYHVIQ